MLNSPVRHFHTRNMIINKLDPRPNTSLLRQRNRLTEQAKDWKAGNNKKNPRDENNLLHVLPVQPRRDGEGAAE